MLWFSRTRIWLDCGAFTPYVSYYINSWYCLRAKQNSDICPFADALWPVSNELLAFVWLPVWSCPFHRSQQHSRRLAAQLKPCRGQGLHGIPEVNCSHSWTMLLRSQEPCLTLHLLFRNGSPSKLPIKHLSMFEGDLIVDLPSIVLASRFWPCVVWYQVTALEANSCLQCTGQKVCCARSKHPRATRAPYYFLPPHPILTSSRISSQPVRILRRTFFIHLWFWGLQMTEASEMVVTQSNAWIPQISGLFLNEEVEFILLSSSPSSCILSSSSTEKFLAACSSMDLTRCWSWHWPKSPFVTPDEGTFSNHVPHVGAVTPSPFIILGQW